MTVRSEVQTLAPLTLGNLVRGNVGDFRTGAGAFVLSDLLTKPNIRPTETASVVSDKKDG